MLISENLTFQRFNTSIVPSAQFYAQWDNERGTAINRDARIVRQSRPYWRADLSGCQLSLNQTVALNAMNWRNRGDARPVLVGWMPFCEIGHILDDPYQPPRDAFGNLIVTPEYIGDSVNDGMPMQLRKRIFSGGYENEFIYYPVSFPHWKYPPQYAVGSTLSGKIEWNILRPIKIYANGVLLAENQFSLDRDTGALIPLVAGRITAEGGFYVKMLMPPFIPIGQDPEKRHDVYMVGGNVKLEEPNGGY